MGNPQTPTGDVSPELADGSWLGKWAPECPDGNPQRLGFRLKGPDYLQLRVILTPRDGRVCAAVIEEHPAMIVVRAIACLPDDGPDGRRRARQRELVDCPFNIWLDAPLGERVVIDVDTGRKLRLYIPRYDTDEPSLYIPRPRGVLWPQDGEAPIEESTSE